MKNKKTIYLIVFILVVGTGLSVYFFMQQHDASDSTYYFKIPESVEESIEEESIEESIEEVPESVEAAEPREKVKAATEDVEKSIKAKAAKTKEEGMLDAVKKAQERADQAAKESEDREDIIKGFKEIAPTLPAPPSRAAGQAPPKPAQAPSPITETGKAGAGAGKFDVSGVIDRGRLLTVRGARSGAIYDEKETSKETSLLENKFINTTDWDNPTAYPSISGIGRVLIFLAIEVNELPTPGTIQINELVNAYKYHFPKSTNEVSLLIYLHPCPWNDEHFVLMLGAKVMESYTIKNIQNPHWSIQFMKDNVFSYRKLGQEDYFEALDTENISSLNPGESAITLYEIIPTKDKSTDSWAKASFQYVVNSEIKNITLTVTKEESNQSEDFILATAFAELGLILRNSAYKGDASLDRILEHIIDIISSHEADVEELRYIIGKIKAIKAEN